MSTLSEKIRKIPYFAKEELRDFGEMLCYVFSLRHFSPLNLTAHRKGFADHRPKTKDDRDLEIGKRILRAYQYAKEGEAEAPRPYKLRGEWQRIIDVEFANLVRCLKSQDLHGLMQLLSNMCRNECTRGLVLSSTYLTNKYRPFYRFSYINEFHRNIQHWKRAESESLDLERIAMPLVGNPPGLFVNGLLLASVNVRHLYYARQLARLLPQKESVVCEIGGGYGGMAAFLLKERSEKLCYINFDLPEINAVNSYFLLKAFPHKRVILYGESSNDLPSLLKDEALIIYPHYTFPLLGDLSVDVVFNSRSMTEMEEPTVREYYQKIARCCRGYFYHTNHDDDHVYDPIQNKRHLRLSAIDLPKDRFETIFHKRTSFFNPKYYDYCYKLRTS